MSDMLIGFLLFYGVYIIVLIVGLSVMVIILFVFVLVVMVGGLVVVGDFVLW